MAQIQPLSVECQDRKISGKGLVLILSPAAQAQWLSSHSERHQKESVWALTQHQNPRAADTEDKFIKLLHSSCTPEPCGRECLMMSPRKGQGSHVSRKWWSPLHDQALTGKWSLTPKSTKTPSPIAMEQMMQITEGKYRQENVNRENADIECKIKEIIISCIITFLSHWLRAVSSQRKFGDWCQYVKMIFQNYSI